MSGAKSADEKGKKEKPQNLPKATKGTRLPALWEVVITYAKIIVTLLGMSMFVVSYINGASLIWCAIRAGAAMLAVGLVFWLMYWMVVRGSLDLAESLIKERQNEINSQFDPSNTREFAG